MRLRVDSSNCQGHARCAALFPEAFHLDEEGKATVVLDLIPAELEELGRTVVANCPERAISEF